MSKNYFLLFFICFLNALNINARVYEGSCGDNVKYSLDTSTGLLKITGTGAMKKNTFDTSVPWYSNRSYIKAVEISNGVTTIGDYAFYSCSNLVSITIPNSVTSIEKNVFWNCSNLTSVIIGSGVKSIGGFVFSSKPAKVIWLTNTPPSGYVSASGIVNYVANSNYTEFNNKIVYPFLSSMFEVDGIRYVPVSPSERTCDAIDCVYNESAEKITIGEKVTNKGISLDVKQVRPYTCYGNTFIKDVDLHFIGNLGNNAFNGCSGISSAIISNQGNIGPNAFEGCTGITSATISNQGNIGEKAFYGCATSGNATFIIENKGYISTSAFESCIGISSATISNQGYIGEKAFCGSATKNPATFVINNKGVVLTSAFEGCTQLKTAELGENISSIGKRVFYGCTKLSDIIIPDAVTSIGTNAFENCSSLSFAKIGIGIKTIPSFAFSGCSSLKDVQIGKNVTSIGEYAFNGCSTLPKIQIPQSVTSIANYAFSGCLGLKTVIMDNGDSDLSLSSNGSNPLFTSCPLDSVYIGRNITYNTSSSYGYSPFYRNTSLRTVVITDKETEISDNEFYGCTNLQSFKVGDGVTSFGKYAFSGCSSLKSLSFGTQLKSIGQEAFSDCTAITSIVSKVTTPPVCGSQALDDINKWDCNLYVPEGTLSAYQAADQWKEFFFTAEGDEEIIPDEQEPSYNKCATPTINVVDGKLQFNCETEGVKFISRIIPPTAFSSEEEKVTLPTTYKITVYAVKEGYDNSDVVTKEIDLGGTSGLRGDLNGDGTVSMPDAMFIVNKILNGKFPDE